MLIRVERIGRHTLMLGDCLELMPKADAVLSDPPYGIAYRHSGHVRGVAAAIGITKAANNRGSPAVIGDAEPFDPTPWLTYPQVLLWGGPIISSRACRIAVAGWRGTSWRAWSRGTRFPT